MSKKPTKLRSRTPAARRDQRPGHRQCLPRWPSTLAAVPAAPSEHALVTTEVAASPEVCFAIAIDLDAYPQWADGIASVIPLEIDEEGRVVRARFEAEAIGRRTRYVLEYDHSEAPHRLSWAQTEGDLTRRLDGAYLFEPSAHQAGHTTVTYELSIDLAVPLPGFVKRRAEAKIMAAALRAFRRRAESVV